MQSLNEMVGPALRTTEAHAVALHSVLTLLERFEQEPVEYCHWKSNEHVGAGLAGETDLDLLVGRGSAGALTRALVDARFKRFVSHPDRSYPGIEDYLGFDPETGRLIHLHVHFQLTLGEPHLKGYRIPWEPLVLATRRLDETGTIYVADPHLELLLLVVRAALKLRVRELLGRTPSGAGLRGGGANEYRWLTERIDAARLGDVARPLVGEEAAASLVRMSGAGVPDVATLLAFRRSVVPRLSEYRMFGSAEARRRRWLREYRMHWTAARERVLGPALPSRRVLPTGGCIIALVGADGSGKSTVARDLNRWLAWKVDVLPVYFGSGAGPRSLPRHLLELVHRCVGAWRRIGRRDDVPRAEAPGGDAGRAHVGGLTGGTADSGVRRRFRDALRAWWALSLAYEKHVRLTQARRARDRGVIVVCDRFPQSQVVGVNDGPLLSDWAAHSSTLRRLVARREQVVYDELRRCPPDIVVKLHASPDVAIRRKPDTGMEMLRRKSQVVRELTYPPAVQVVEVNADGCYEDVLRAVKRRIWEAL